jgi:hypothetical protein
MYYLQNSVLNSLDLREYILGRNCEDPLTLKLLPWYYFCAYNLGKSLKVKESIEDPFK